MPTGANGNPKPPSRQMLYQSKHRELGLCIVCNTPAEPMEGRPGTHSTYCLDHKEAHRERERARIGSRRRNRSASSYQNQHRETHFDPGNGQPTPCGKGTKFSTDWNQVTCKACFLSQPKGT